MNDLIIVVSISEASLLHSFYGTSQLNKAPLISQEDKQHSVARHDGEEVEENGDHHFSAGSVLSSDEQLTTTSTATQHE